MYKTEEIIYNIIRTCVFLRRINMQFEDKTLTH